VTGPAGGDDFGGYRIDAEIGRGGMGVVYRAWQHRMNRPVALKVLPIGVAQDPAYRGRFGREAAALSQLDSPHVIQIYDHGEVDGNLYLAMQLVQGPDLGQLIAAGPMPPRRALRIADQVAAALGDGHAVGVVHRDVKPSNVLSRPRAPHEDEDFVYLCDFGIARNTQDPAGSHTETGAVVGTVAYLAPERLQDQPASPASDVYSLGCLLWALLTGAPPYSGNQVQLIVGHVDGPVPQLRGDDVRTRMLNELLAGLLAKEPGRRPGIAAVRKQIRQILAVQVQDQTATAVPATSTEPAVAATTVADRAGSEPDRRAARQGPPGLLNRRAAIVAGGLAVAVALGGGGWLLRREPVRTAPQRIASSTPVEAKCTDVALESADEDAGAVAQRVCPVGAGVGRLRLVALRGSDAIGTYLAGPAGQDPVTAQAGACPDDLPARASWKRDGRSGTLLCFVHGDNVRYAWTFDGTDVVAVLDGDARLTYPNDVAAVAAFFAAARYPG
jgi:serine/threonine-protein kinase